MAKRKKYINPPTFEDEQELLATIENKADECAIRGRRFRFRMLTGFGQHKISKIIMGEGQSSKDSCKCLAAAWLNGFFSLAFFYWIVWRWFYYIRQYTEDELQPALALVKKKVPQREYLTNTILLIEMRETMMTMNKNEVFLILREKSGANAGNSAKNGSGSPNPS